MPEFVFAFVGFHAAEVFGKLQTQNQATRLMDAGGLVLQWD